MSTLVIKPGLQDLTADMFHSAVGRKFVFRRPAGQESISGGVVELTLLEVKSFAPRAASIAGLVPNASATRRVPFSLLFGLGENMPTLGPGLHRLEDPDFLPEDWYVSRVQVVGLDPGKAYYEAVFG